MSSLRTFFAASLLFASLGASVAHAAPASSLTAPREGAPLSSALLALGSTPVAPGREPAGASGRENAALAEREHATPALEGFRGGGTYVYLGGGATLVLAVLLIILLL